MNEQVLKEYLLANNLDEDNVISIKAFSLEKISGSDPKTYTISINQEQKRKIIKFSFEKYFLLKRNSRGAKDIGRGNIRINQYLSQEESREESLKEIVETLANTFRNNTKNILVVSLFKIEGKDGLIFLTFKPEEFMGIIDGEISTTQSFAEIRKGFIKLKDNDVFLFIDNQNTNDPAEYFIDYLECKPTKTDFDITLENRKHLYDILKSNLPQDCIRRFRTETARYLINSRNTIFNIDNFLENLSERFPDVFNESRKTQIKESYDTNSNILTKDFLIKINITKEKKTLKINDGLSIKASEEEILGFDLSGDGNSINIKIDSDTRDKIQRIKRSNLE